MTIRAPIYTRIERAGSAVALLQLEPQDRLVNLLKSKDTFFGPPGCPPDYDWPNPRGPEYPIALRTWINVLSLELRSQDKQFGGPGDWQTYDYPNPRGPEYPISLRTWIDPLKLELLSKDKQFGAAGDWQSYDYPNPIIRDAGIRDSIQANRLLDLLARPVVPGVFANPLAPQAWMLDQQGNLLPLTAVIAVPSTGFNPGAGGGKSTPARKLKKRWWQIGDKVYQGTQEQAAKALDAFVADQIGEGEVEAIRLPSKPAPSRAAPKDSTLAKVAIPDLDFNAFDWRSMYAQYVLQRDFEMASALQAAIQRRIDQDEDDVEVILLLH